MNVMTLRWFYKAFYHDSLDINNPEHREVSALRLIAKMPTIAAWAYKYSLGQPVIYPSNNLTYAENFMRMTFATPSHAPDDVGIILTAPDLHLFSAPLFGYGPSRIFCSLV